MRVIGTAGHVDHGKSTLVQALTGIDPDRLKEEKSRGMTIDLGFAWFDLTLPDQNRPEPIGVVDVPGHIDFIKNMLAGVGGIDAAILVIAADEGVMLQTREHLDILDLLAAPSLIVAITKTDLVDDDEWLDLVELDVVELLHETRYSEAPIVRASPLTDAGMDVLRQTIVHALVVLPERRNRERPRLPIDRVFSLSGFGTVVTGTLSDGHFAVGDEVVILPAGVSARVRGLQTHQQSVQRGEPGSRLAMNLSGVATHEVSRGDVVVHPNTLSPTSMIDVSFRLLPLASGSLRHNDSVGFYTGATESMARVRLLGTDELAPGESGWLQLRLEHPVVVAPGDRYILRQPSPSATLGGGSVVVSHPQRRWRRFDKRILDRLETLSAGTPDEIVFDTLSARAFQTSADLSANCGLDVEMAKSVIADLIAGGAIIELQAGAHPLLITASQRDELLRQLADIVEGFHVENPLRAGIAKGELRSRLLDRYGRKLDVRTFNAAIELAEQEGRLSATDSLVNLPDFSVVLTSGQQQRVDKLMTTLELAGVSSPSQTQVLAILGEEQNLFDLLLEDGRLVRIGDGVVYRSEDFQSITQQVLDFVGANGAISLAQARDLLDTSRRYAQAILEELDARRITRREDDVRVLRSQQSGV